MKDFKYFYHPDFDDETKRKLILKKMPNNKSFCEEKQRIISSRSKVDVSLLPCYQEPLLEKDQEYHLFRKMNYFKHKAFCTNFQKRYLQQADEVRNQIAGSNFRLAIQVLKEIKRTNSPEILSDAYLSVIKAVDYFDWRMGIKFSTYCTWVIKNNFFRELKNKSDVFSNVDDFDFPETIEEFSDINSSESLYKLFSFFQENATDREIYIIENYYGLNGKKKQTLEEISQFLRITKERVRQIKEESLGSMKKLAEKLKIEPELLF